MVNSRGFLINSNRNFQGQNKAQKISLANRKGDKKRNEFVLIEIITDLTTQSKLYFNELYIGSS